MKLSKKMFSLIILFVGIYSAFAQNVTQPIDKPAEGKSLVYFVRSGAGYLLNFRIYDKDKFLGSISGSKYLVYECNPGEHTFWAASENRDYVDANLEPNSVYVINAQGQMGAFIAGVNLKPLDPTAKADRKLFYQVIKHDDKMPFNNPGDDKAENVVKGLSKYQDLKAKNSDKIKVLRPEMKFENADKP